MMVERTLGKRPMSVKEMIVVVGLFAIDFAAWAAFPAVSFFAFLGLVALLGVLALVYVPQPWDLVLIAALGTMTMGVMAGLVVSG